jgi:hypothetical protein
MLTAIGLVWASIVAAGMVWLTLYDSSPGAGAHPPQRWPLRATLSRGAYTLVMAAHPRCPCTRASLDELALVMAASQGQVTAHVLFFAPADAASDWWTSDLWNQAQAIPGVTAHVDRGGQMQSLFGALTSGTVVVYDRDDRLRFNGGVTFARGHAGENDGRLSLIALMNTGQEALAGTPVFGCPLRGPVAKADSSSEAVIP